MILKESEAGGAAGDEAISFSGRDCFAEFILSSVEGMAAEADRLTSDADRVLRDLDTRGAYRGPVRSQMTTEEKAELIKRHGKERYLALPW